MQGMKDAASINVYFNDNKCKSSLMFIEVLHIVQCTFLNTFMFSTYIFTATYDIDSKIIPIWQTGKPQRYCRFASGLS